jgi:hypothetical protein
MPTTTLAKLAATVAALAALAGGLWATHHHIYTSGLDAGRAEVQARWAEANAQATQTAIDTERRWQKTTDEAAHEKAQAELRLRADAARARAERDGLLNDLTTLRASLPAATSATVLERADAIGELFGECARDIEQLAAKADRHAADARALMGAWPR